MNKNTATTVNRNFPSPDSEQKLSVASLLAEPSPNGQPTSEEVIRLRAYVKWESAGKPAGDGTQFWLEAEKELSQSNKHERNPS